MPNLSVPLYFDGQALEGCNLGLESLESIQVSEARSNLHARLDVDLSLYKQDGFDAIQTAQAFPQSAQFEPYGQSLVAIFNDWVALLKGSANQIAARRAFDLLLFRLGVNVSGHALVERSYFGFHLGLMYTLGSQMIKDMDRIVTHCKSLQQPEQDHALDWCRSAIQNLADGVQKCAPGCIDNIRQQTIRLAGLVFPQNLKSQIQSMMHSILLHQAKLFAGLYSRPYWLQATGNDEFYENNEIHIVNGLYNAVCERVSLPPIVDEYALSYKQDWEKSPTLTQFSYQMTGAMTPEAVVKQMAGQLVDKLLGQVTENPSANFPQLKDEIEQALCQAQGQNHGIDPTCLIVSNSDYTEFSLASSTTLLELHFLEAISSSNLVVYSPIPQVLIPDLQVAPARKMALHHGLYFVESNEPREPGQKPIRQALTVEHLELDAVIGYLKEGFGDVFDLVWESFANSSTQHIEEFLNARPDFASIAPQRLHLLKRAKSNPCLQNILRLESYLNAQENGSPNQLGRLSSDEYFTGHKGPGDDYWTLETLRDWSCSEYFQVYSPEEIWRFSLLPGRMGLKTFDLLKWVAVNANPFLMDCIKNVDFFNRMVRDMDSQLLVRPQTREHFVQDLLAIFDYISMSSIEQLGWMVVIKKLADRHYPGVSQMLEEVNQNLDFIVSHQIIANSFNLVRALHQVTGLASALGPLTWEAAAQSPYREWYRAEFNKMGIFIPL